jgi:molybdenum cofactor cytidylyltransferase
VFEAQIVLFQVDTHATATHATAIRANIEAMNDSIRPRLRVAILAAGYSRRMGRPKALLRVQGQSLLRRTARLLASVAHGPLICIVPPRAARYRAELRGLRVELRANPHRAHGLATSVRAALQAARYASALLCVPVDLARLRRHDLERLLRRSRASPRRVVARRLDPGTRGGIPVILPRRYFPAAAGVVGDVGLRDFLATLPAGDLRLIELRSASEDVDTPRDLLRARQRFGSRP